MNMYAYFILIYLSQIYYTDMLISLCNLLVLLFHSCFDYTNALAVSLLSKSPTLMHAYLVDFTYTAKNGCRSAMSIYQNSAVHILKRKTWTYLQAKVYRLPDILRCILSYVYHFLPCLIHVTLFFFSYTPLLMFILGEYIPCTLVTRLSMEFINFNGVLSYLIFAWFSRIVSHI